MAICPFLIDVHCHGPTIMQFIITNSKFSLIQTLTPWIHLKPNRSNVLAPNRPKVWNPQIVQADLQKESKIPLLYKVALLYSTKCNQTVN